MWVEDVQGGGKDSIQNDDETRVRDLLDSARQNISLLHRKTSTSIWDEVTKIYRVWNTMETDLGSYKPSGVSNVNVVQFLVDKRGAIKLAVADLIEKMPGTQGCSVGWGAGLGS
jgi:hypothetical protein